MNNKAVSVRSKTVTLGAAAIMLVAGCSDGAQEASEEYPQEDIQVIIPYDAGGPTDAMGRAVADYLEEDLGVSVVAENRAGASGTIGMGELAASDPDGYTIGLLLKGPNVISPVVMDLPYEGNDIQAIGMIADTPTGLLVGPDSDIADMEDLLERATEGGETFSVATAGANAPSQIYVEELADEGVDVNPIPFDSSAEQLTAILGENVDVASLNFTEEIVAQVESGDLVPLAVAGPERLDYLPDMPTLPELGYEGLTHGSSFFALGAPAGTPEGVLEVLESSLESALQDPDVRSIVGERYIPDEFMNGEELQSYMDELTELYSDLLSEE